MMQYFFKEKKRTIHENFLIEPPFKRLLSKALKQEAWYSNYFPQVTLNQITVFKCLQVDSRDIFFEKMVHSSCLGVDSLTNRCIVHALHCSHYEVLEQPQVELIAEKINQKILE
jgi:hypothetical protein